MSRAEVVKMVAENRKKRIVAEAEKAIELLLKSAELQKAGSISKNAKTTT
jgi:hypothetical protein